MKMNVLRIAPRFVTVASLLFFVGRVMAAPYFGESFTYRQPDGETFSARLWGDEFFAYQETEDGYLVVRDPKKGVFCYAKVTPDGRDIISTGVRVGRALPPGLKPKQRLAPAAAHQKSLPRRKKFNVDPSGRPLFPVSAASGGSTTDTNDPIVMAPPSSTTIGRRVGLVLLAAFPDRLSDTNAVTRAEVDDYCNEVGYTGFGNAASVRDYFRVQSDGMLDYTNAVTAYFVAANNRDYYTDPAAPYGSRARALITEGLNALNAQGFDFLQLDADGDGYVDGINCFYAGNVVNSWSEGLWPHASSLNWSGFTAFGLNTYSRYQITEIGTSLQIGTFCHENAHMLCRLPDLYSYDGNAANFGNFSLMASGSYGGGGYHPTHIDAYLKMHAGWSDIVDLDSSSHERCAVQVDRNHVYRYRNPARSTEYFLFEVRDNTGYEGPYGGASGSVNPTAGLVAYHGLQSGSNPHSSIFTADNPACDYSKPYELLVVEAAPTTARTPWYDDPTPATSDGFKASGVNEISDSTFPELKFWDATGRNTTSDCHIHDISTDGSTMTFVIGTGAVTNPPTMVVNATAFDLYEEAGLQVNDQKFGIYNSGTGTFSYVVSTNVPWLSVSPASGSVGTEVDEITITCDSSGLSSGAHNGTITITSPDAQDSPQVISYIITIIGEASAPVVTVQPTGAHLLGDQNYTLSSWVTGSPEPDKQWYKDGTVVSGATANDLDLVDVTAAEAGNYYLVASNSQGVTTSDTAVITVDDHPAIAFATPVEAYVGVPSGMGLCLEAAVTDDGYGGSSLSYSWTTESAPGGESVTWDNQTSNATAAAFTGDGDYTLRITASDGEPSNDRYLDYFVTVGAAPSGPTGTVSSADQIVLFELDEGSGTTAIDGAGGNNNGTLSGGAAFIPAAVFAGGVDFDGVNGRITLGNSSEINTATFPKRTIAFWFKADSLSGRQLLYEEGGAGRGFNFYLDNSTLYWGGWNSNENGWGNSFIPGPALDPDTWYHVALVLDASPGSTSLETDVFRVYLDGSLYGTDDAAPINAHSDGIALGGVNGSTKYHSGSPAGDYFNGQVDAFHLYNRALTAVELEILAYADPNIGPNVDAGAQVSGSTGTNVALDGTITDDGLPALATITTEWLMISGPGSMSFGDSAAVDTTATAGSDGTYTLRLTADDTHTKTFDETTLLSWPTVPGVLQIESATYSIGEGGGQVAVQVRRAEGQSGAVSVSFAASDGTATNGSDYTLTPGSLDYADEEAGLKSILVSITDDAVNEGDETFDVSIFTPTGGASLGSTTNTTVTIIENDVPPAAPSALVATAVDRYQVDLSWADNSDNEDNFLVQRSLTGGSGFTDLVLVAADTTAYSDTTVAENTTYYYKVVATNAYGSASTGEASDTTPATQHGTLSLSSATYAVDENGGSLVVTVTRTGGADDAVSIDIDTSDNTALAGVDYTASSQILNWSDEDVGNKTLIVPILDNGVYQGNRTFYVDLTNPVGSPGLGTTSSTVTIVDDEPIPTGARVISQSPVASVPQTPDTDQLTLVFNESIQTSSFSVASDVVAFTGGYGVDLRGTITGHSWANNDTELTITFAPLVSNAVYRMVIGPDILNMAGWPMDQNDDLVLGEADEDQYAANIWVSSGTSLITLWSDLYESDDTPGPGWTLSHADWEFGDPSENGTTGPDASSPGGSGTNVLAQNLSGNYTTGADSYAETPAIDATECTAVYLDFNEWKGMDKKDELYIELVYGTTSNKVYSFAPNQAYNDGSWGANNIDISADVVGETFQIRWGLTDVTTGSGVGTGWQLDEILVTGELGIAPPLPPVVLSHSPAGAFAGTVSSFYLDFSQPMDPASFVAADDVTFTDPSLTPITITGTVWVSSSLLRLDFAEQSADGTYSLVLAPTVLDDWGHELDQDKDGAAGEAVEDQFSGGFTIDSNYFIAAPSGLSAAAASSTQIDLNWADNSDNETGFVIERSLTSGSGFAGVAAVAADSTNYVDSPVSSKTTYYYRVLATNAVAASDPSAQASATTPNSPPVVDAGTNQTVYLSVTDVLWTPAQIAAVAWYDADDADTITESGGAVSQWDDKSGNNRHATQAGPANQPTYQAADAMVGNMPSIGNIGTNGLIGLDTPSMSAKNAYVVTYYKDGLDGNFDGYSTLISGPNTWGAYRVMGRLNSDDFYDTNHFNDSGTFKNGATTSSAIVLPMPASLLVLKSTAARTQTYHLGYNSQETTRDWQGFYSEFIFTDGSEDLATQQKIEGYLAHKWGLEGDLPAGHPYKSAPPMVEIPSATAVLDGTVTDIDDTPTTTWSKFAGAGTVLFGDASAVDTTAEFAGEGTYTLRLTADDGYGAVTDDVVVVVGGVAAPSSLTATAVSSSQIDLAWSDNSTNETDFVIERSLSSLAGFAPLATAAGNSTNYTDTAVSAGVTYYYRVRATNTYASSFASGISSATAPKLAAIVTLSDLAHTYDGSSKTATVDTTPAGLTVDVTYDGSGTAPVNAGSYAVTAVVNEVVYEGWTNGTLVVAKAVPTVTNWPTAADIVLGQALSAATLSGGGASVPGSFDYDTPGYVPPLGVYTAAVSFIPTDSANYETVGGGTVEVTVNPPLPAAPTGLTGSASPGQVALTWQSVQYATGYNVKRSTTAGGPYTTIDSTASTNATDTAVTNGATYYYVVSALNGTGEGSDSAEAAATMLHAIPYTEDFEARTPGALNAQDGWSAEHAFVQSVDAIDAQACSITNELGFTSQSFFGGHSKVWTDMMMKPAFSEGDMTPEESDLTTALYFDVDGHPVVFDGTTMLCLSNTTVIVGEWVRVTVKSDYAAQTWDLYIDGELAASGLGFYSTTTTQYTAFEVSGAGLENSVVDEIIVDTRSPIRPPATLLIVR